jgi:cytochrome P450
MTAAGVSRGVVVPNLFSSADKEWHRNVRRAVSSAFALSTLIQYEPLVTETIAEFVHAIETRIVGKLGSEGLVDFSKWANYFALDVISKLTFGSPYGLLKTGRDDIGIIHSRYNLTRYFFVVGYLIRN